MRVHKSHKISSFSQIIHKDKNAQFPDMYYLSKQRHSKFYTQTQFLFCFFEIILSSSFKSICLCNISFAFEQCPVLICSKSVDIHVCSDLCALQHNTDNALSVLLQEHSRLQNYGGSKLIPTNLHTPLKKHTSISTTQID